MPMLTQGYIDSFEGQFAIGHQLLLRALETRERMDVKAARAFYKHILYDTLAAGADYDVTHSWKRDSPQAQLFDRYTVLQRVGDAMTAKMQIRFKHGEELPTVEGDSKKIEASLLDSMQNEETYRKLFDKIYEKCQEGYYVETFEAMLKFANMTEPPEPGEFVVS